VVTTRMINDRDLDALKRALLWGRIYQMRELQIRVLPDPMPADGTPEWIAMASRVAAIAQAYHLGLKPWQCAPIHVAADAVAADCYGCRRDEIALCQRMRDLGVSRFEPDPPTALDAAERRAARPRRASQRK
jgi:hypothetical protein